MTNGMVLGHFMPLHAGHVALIRTAAALVDHLTLVVCWRADDSPAPVTRLQWLLEMFPSCRVVGLEEPPGGFADAGWWARAIADFHPDPVDQLFASGRAPETIAREIGARLMLIDPGHDAVPVRSEAVRAGIDRYWHAIPPAVRPAYARTICLHGPESTGKSTLAPLLARHYGTLFVPEHGRTYTEQFGRELGMDDLVTIGRTHAALTQALLRQCNGRLILDTDPIMTAVWADMLFARRDPWFDAFDQTADLYLLLGIDAPFVEDGIRFFGHPEQRQRFFDLSRDELERRGLRYSVIDGPLEERFDRAVAAIAAAGL